MKWRIYLFIYLFYLVLDETLLLFTLLLQQLGEQYAANQKFLSIPEKKLFQFTFQKIQRFLTNFIK